LRIVKIKMSIADNIIDKDHIQCVYNSYSDIHHIKIMINTRTTAKYYFTTRIMLQ